MQTTVFYLMVLALQGGVMGVGDPCAPGAKVADNCYEIAHQGCCTDDSAVRWCEGGVLCELSCAAKPACGWKSGAGVYDCAATPKGDPACVHPYSCLVDGCAPAWEQKGCCDCPCEDCVCAKDPYCCNVSWDPVCVDACRDCGGCGSTDGCTPSPTPGCHDCSCQECVCAIDSFCCTGKWDSLCAAMCADECGGGCEVCKPNCNGKECGTDGCAGLCGVCPNGYDCTAGECVKICVPSCEGRDCGLDSCGLKSCGTCADGYFCNKFFKCLAEPCEPKCDGKACGSDTCGGSCGDCEEDVPCVDGVCVPGACQPQCDGKQCGDDGCGGQCGFCDPESKCNFDTGKCVKYCKPSCLGKQCGDDGCGDVCGTCPAGLSCTPSEGGGTTCTAACFPYCTAKECGPDYCGDTCGTCPAEKPACSKLLGYNCVEAQNCAPNCLGQECGDDGCGGTCGACPGNWYCQGGMCVPSCTPQCLVPPLFISYKQCGWDECPGQNVCGVCPEGHYCSEGYICVEDKCSCAGKQCGVPGDGCPACGECLESETCDPLTFQCIPCQSNCTNDEGQPKQCGNDGCDGSCGECPAGYTCDETIEDGDPATFTCEPCVPSCVNDLGQVKQCGSDGCGNQCGQCPPGLVCKDELNEGLCVECVAVCDHPLEIGVKMPCGPNSCPAGCMDVPLGPCTSMSDCALGQQCNAMTGQCVACGSCGSCPVGWICDVNPAPEPEDDLEIYVCQICQPNCDGKECGDNNCGGMCGVCPAGFDCTEEGLCEKDCNPTAGCFGKECGPNGCPHGCLEEGAEECGVLSTCPEGLICDPNSNMCVPCKGNCGQCGSDEYCAAGYICLEKPDLCAQNNWKCGDDGAGTSCGDCDPGYSCVEHECIEDGGPDVIEGEDIPVVDTDVPGVDVPDEECPDGYVLKNGECVKDEPNPCPDGYKLENNQCVPDVLTCPEGYHPFFGQCVKDEEEDTGGGGGCSCSTLENNRPLPPSWLLMVLLGLGLYVGLRRRPEQS